MKRCILLVTLLLVLGAGGTSKAGYGWHTCWERTAAGEPIPFRTGDTLIAAVQSNDCIHIEGQPVFYEVVVTGASAAMCPMDSAIFLGPPPVFGTGLGTCSPAPIAQRLRQGAAEQGHFHDFPGETVRAVFRGASVTFYRWPTGTPFDSTIVWAISISYSGTCIFVNGPLEVKGTVTGKVTIGCSGRLRLLDNITYADLNWPRWYYADYELPSANNVLGLVSESDVVIANTPVNGRDNSGMPNGTWGRQQTNQNLTSIVITAAIEVLNGSLTFEDQNDSAGGYVSESWPDDRGKVYLFGSVRQYRRGYLNRTNNIFTGYHLYLRYDRRLAYRNPPCVLLPGPEGETTDTVSFGDVIVGESAWDTAHVYTSLWGTLGAVYASYPFYATRTEPFDGTHFIIPVRFTPPRAEQFRGFLTVVTVDHFHQIPLFGHGVPASTSDSSFILHPSAFILSAFPNPFNARTEIRFSLPQAGNVELDLFDITGRKVMTVLDEGLTAGEHAVALDGSGLASGVYFVRLHAAQGQRVFKIALIR